MTKEVPKFYLLQSPLSSHHLSSHSLCSKFLRVTSLYVHDSHQETNTARKTIRPRPKVTKASTLNRLNVDITSFLPASTWVWVADDNAFDRNKLAAVDELRFDLLVGQR